MIRLTALLEERKEDIQKAIKKGQLEPEQLKTEIKMLAGKAAGTFRPANFEIDSED